MGTLLIPRVGIETSVYYGPDRWASPENEKLYDELLEYGAVHWDSMPLPGEESNSVVANMRNLTHLFAHRTSGPAPFRDLDKVKKENGILFAHADSSVGVVEYKSRYDNTPIVPIEVKDAYTQAVNEVALHTRVPYGDPPLSEAEWELVESATGLLRPILPTIRLVACTSKGSTISKGSTHSRIVVDGEQTRINS